MSVTPHIASLYRQNEAASLEDFCTFLSFPSISSEPEYAPAMADCANWLCERLEKIGFSVEQWPTSGYPVVYAHYFEAGPDQPTLLIYNHYDVQPVDPLEDWLSPPFVPTVRNGAIYARGAQDNKGQCFYVLQALALLMHKDGRLPINIKLCIEGEEECGSSGLHGILQEHIEELRADYLAVVDLGIPSHDTPSLTLGIRGITSMDVTATASTTDLHSGSHGGLAYNPIHALVAVLSQLRDSDGKINVPGFYEGVLQSGGQDLNDLNLDFDEASYQNTFGIPASGGERALPPLERNWLRPTLEINGISGGYTGNGLKTVIPAKAHAKISCRLVIGQDPHYIAACVARQIEALAPEGVTMSVLLHPGAGPAVSTQAASPLAKAFAQALTEVYGVPCQFVMEGASIPIVADLQHASGSTVVMLGLGLSTDCIHAPNEHFGLDRLEKGTMMFARGIELLAQKNRQLDCATF